MLIQQGIQDALNWGNMAASLIYGPLWGSSKEAVKFTMTSVWEGDYKNGKRGYFLSF